MIITHVYEGHKVLLTHWNAECLNGLRCGGNEKTISAGKTLQKCQLGRQDEEEKEKEDEEEKEKEEMKKNRGKHSDEL